MSTGALSVAGLIFAIVAYIHLIRLFFPFNVTIGSYEVPLWINAIAFVIIGLLSSWMFASRKA